MILYSPVGEQEYILIKESGYTAFPPRLPEQPIFYPVLNEQYAAEIASRWNTKDIKSGFQGYVTRFEICDSFMKRYEVQTVGRSYHQEYWIPAEDLAEFNQHIVGRIKVIKSVQGSEFTGSLNRTLTDAGKQHNIGISGKTV